MSGSSTGKKALGHFSFLFFSFFSQQAEDRVSIIVKPYDILDP
jgi:hypothetical protein